MDKTVAFTGHMFIGHHEDYVREALGKAIEHFQGRGYDTFISGGALDTDQWAAQEVAVRGRANLIIARPFPSQAAKWTAAQKEKYERILRLASQVVDVNPDPPAKWKYHARNRWMVDRCSVLVAVWDERNTGGTYATLRYAEKKGKTLYWINPVTREVLVQHPSPGVYLEVM